MIAHRRWILRILAGAASVPILPAIGFALEYPKRPVRIVVGFAPGGVPDLIARLLGQWLSERLGQPFVVENHPGAASNLALEDVAKGRPDGYTLFEVSVANAINESLYQGANVEHDIALIASIASAAFVLVVGPSSSVQKVPALIARAKSDPGKLNFGSSPTGTPPYLAVSLFKKIADVDFVQVPFRNSVQAVEELLGGRLDVAISDMSALGYVKAGKLRALAVTTARRQRPSPTFQVWPNFCRAITQAPGMALAPQRTRLQKSSTLLRGRWTPLSRIRNTLLASRIWRSPLRCVRQRSLKRSLPARRRSGARL